MNPVTTRDRIRGVAERWRIQYDGDVYQWSHEVLERLLALDLETATAEEVDDIIGNTCWTRILCHCCLKSVDWAVAVTHGDSSRSTTICRDCLTKAVARLGDET